MKLRSISIRKHTIPSRYFFAPVNTGFTEAGAPTERLIQFHSRRSGRGIGISYVGNVAIGAEYVTNSATPILGSKLRPWHRLVDTILSNGSVPAAQIGCRLASEVASRKWLRRTDASVSAAQSAISSISTQQLRAIVDGFGETAKKATKVGFQVVQVHAAHGYLLSLFMNTTLNRRTDTYGRDPLRLLSEVADAVATSAPYALIDVRVSVRDGIDAPETEHELRANQIAQISNMGFDMVSLSSGTYDFSRQLIYPSEKDGKNTILPHALHWCSAYPNLVWNAAGNIRDLEAIDAGLPSNLTLAVCRPLLADPEFITKHVEGRQADIRACDWRGKCHYYTRGKLHVTCPLSLDLAENEFDAT